MLASTGGRVVGALTVSVLAASSFLIAPQAHAATPDPVGDGAAWLISQTTDGIVQSGPFPDYSTTVDIALALRAVGGHGADVDTIAAALSPNLKGATGYIEADEYDWQEPYEFKQHGYYSGPTAKALYFAQVTGQNLDTFGGGGLVAALEARTSDDTGAIHDDSFFGDYGNTIGQTFAAKALTTAGSGEAAKATDWLLAHQCEGGGFSLDIGQEEGSCPGNDDADPDVTSFFLIVFGEDVANATPRIARAVGKAEAWLLSRQKADGSFNGGASTAYSNTNSTGLAGWALGELGDVDAATNAAIWLRRHQVQTVTGCTDQLATHVGAIAYDDAALTSGRTAGIPANKQYQWRLGSAQALPALQWAPTSASNPALTGPTTYVQTGGRATVKATGLTPGSWVCAGTVPGSAGLSGTASISAKVPTGATGTKTITLTVADGTSASTTVKALAAKTLSPTVTRTVVPRGGTQTVRVSGLAANEPLKIIYGGKVIKTGKASSTGTYGYAFPVGRTTGSKSVKVQGAFTNRVGSKTFRVS